MTPLTPAGQEPLDLDRLAAVATKLALRATLGGPRMTPPEPKRRLRVEWPPTAAVREVIEVTFRRGTGDDESDPVRVVTAYHALDGTLLAEFDPSKGTIR